MGGGDEGEKETDRQRGKHRWRTGKKVCLDYAHNIHSKQNDTLSNNRNRLVMTATG